MLYYITFIDTNYFVERKEDNKNIISQKNQVKNFILYILYGYDCETNKFDTQNIDVSFMNEQDDRMKKLLNQITFSSLHLLFNQTAVVKYFDFCHKDINGIKIDKDAVKKNFKNIFSDFYNKTKDFENSGNSVNIEKNFKLFTEIECKTTDNSSVNIYILNQIEEIFIYSITMDVATTIKIKKEEKEGGLELLDNRIKYNSQNK